MWLFWRARKVFFFFFFFYINLLCRNCFRGHTFPANFSVLKCRFSLKHFAWDKKVTVGFSLQLEAKLAWFENAENTETRWCDNMLLHCNTGKGRPLILKIGNCGLDLLGPMQRLIRRNNCRKIPRTELFKGRSPTQTTHLNFKVCNCLSILDAPFLSISFVYFLEFF